MLSGKLKNYMNSTLMIITNKIADYNYIKSLDENYEYVLIEDSTSLIEALELAYPGQLMTLVITDNMPEDIKQTMSIFVKTLQDIKGLNVVEFRDSETYFRNSLKIDDLYEFEASEDEKRYSVKTKEKDVYLITDKEDNYGEGNSLGDKEDNTLIINSDNEEKTVLNRDSINIKKDTEEKIDRLNDIITVLDAELKNNVSEMEKVIHLYDNLETENDKLNDKLSMKEKEINNLKLQGNLNNEESGDLLEELKSKEVFIQNLEKDIKELKVKGVELEIDSTSKRELIKDKNKEIKEIKNEVNELKNAISSLNENMDNISESHVSIEKLEKLDTLLKEKDIEIASLNDQVRVLKIDIRKSLEDRHYIDEEFENLQNSYKELVANGNSENNTNDYKDVFLSDDVRTSIFYFKVFNQPPYFKSFVESVQRIISNNGKTLLLIIKELDDISRMYYEGINEYNNLDEISKDNNETVIILKPSKLMLSEDEDFYSNYRNIIVLDYSRTRKVLIKGTHVYNISTFMNEKEKDLLGLEGMTLTVGETSIVDLKYDNNFKFAKTAYVKKGAVDKKVKNWLSNIGIRV